MEHSTHWKIAAVTAGALTLAGTAQGAGFAIIEQGVSGLGNAYAGAAASAEDATTVFFNPAGMTRLSSARLTLAGHIIRPSAKFSDSGTTDALGNPIASGGNGGDAGGVALVPNAYYTRPLANDTILGIGINAPFGLTTEYDDNWVGRYQAIKSELKTVNINPSLAWKASDLWSLGAGINIQYIEAELSNALDTGSICYGLAGPATCGLFGLAPQQADGKATIEGDDWSFGFNLGALYEFDADSRIGIAYRSRISHTLKGNADFTIPAAFQNFLTAASSTAFSDTGASASVSLPETLSVSAYHALDERWAILADVTWTRWSRFKELRVRFDSGQPDSVTDEHWENALRYSLGMNYRYNDRWLLRAGVAFDEEPIPDAAHRTPRIPGNDRRWLALGASYRGSARMSLDVGYAHLFVRDTPIAHANSSAGSIIGNYDNSVDILSAQMNWTF